MPRRSDIAKILVIGSAIAASSPAFCLCGSMDNSGRSKTGTAHMQRFVQQQNNQWKKVVRFPDETDPDSGELALLSTDSSGWSMVWIYTSTEDWIWTKNYCFSPVGGLTGAESRFSCAWGWVARQSINVLDGNTHKSSIVFIDNKTNKQIRKPDSADDFRDDYGEFQVYRNVGELPFAKVLSKTGAVK